MGRFLKPVPRLRWVCWLLPLSATVAVSAQNCASSPQDEAAVVQTMRTWYAAETADDYAKFNSVMSPKFFAYDGGRRFDGDSLLHQADVQRAKGYQMVWEITEPEVHVQCNMAWIAFVNRGSVKKGSDPVIPLSWLESAVLERDGAAWKLRFFQSTRVPPSPPPAAPATATPPAASPH